MIKIEENLIKELRTLKGAPLSVYFAIYFANQIVTIKWIEMVTGYSDKPVTKAIRLLLEYQFILKNSRGFSIKKEKQLILGDDLNKNKKYLMLKDFGIGEPVLSELSCRDDLNDQYIKEQIEQAKRKKISTGLLIHKIRCKDKVEEIIDLEDHRRYLKGPYGEIGSH